MNLRQLQRRVRKLENRYPLNLAMEIAQKQYGVNFTEEQAKKSIKKVIENRILTENEIICLEMRFNKGYKYTQIGYELQITEKEAKKIIEIAQLKIKNELNTIYSQDNSINKLGLTSRSRNVLKRAGVETIGELKMMSDFEILKCYQCGEATLREIREKVGY